VRGVEWDGDTACSGNAPRSAAPCSSDEAMMLSVRNGKRSALVVFLSLLSAACSVRRGSPALPAVTAQHNPDGTATRQVTAGRCEEQAAVEHRLLASIDCPNYEIVAVGQRVEQQAQALYWVRYRCLGDS